VSAATYGLEFVDELPAPQRGVPAEPIEDKPARKRVTPSGHVAGDSDRAHGTYAKYVVERCRCEPCRTAHRAYETRRVHAMSRPDEVWAPYVPAGPVREHVRMLQEFGLGLPRIASLAGVPHGSVARLIYGDYTRTKRPSRRVRPETARKLLAVRPDLEHLGSRRPVPAAPILELVEDLVARGWTKAWIAQQITGRKARALQITRDRGGVVGAGTARRVQALHASLDGQRGPGRRSRWSR